MFREQPTSGASGAPRAGVHTAAAVSFALAICGGALGCSGSPCPERLPVDDSCRVTGNCRVGTRIVTRIAEAGLAPGETFRASLVQFRARFQELPDLFLQYYEYPPPWPGDAVVEMDGVPGAHFVPNPERPECGGSSVRWADLPDAPKELNIRFECTEPISRGLIAWFEDGQCEDDHPGPSPIVEE